MNNAARMAQIDYDNEFGPIEDMDALEEAAVRLRRREYREALYQLTKALGRDFDALANLRPEDLR